MKKVCSVSRRRRAGLAVGAETPRTPSKPFGELDRRGRVGLQWVLVCAAGTHGKAREADLRRVRVCGSAFGDRRKSRDGPGQALGGCWEGVEEGAERQPTVAGQTESGPCGEGSAGVADGQSEHHDVSTTWGSGPGRASRIRTPIPHRGQSRRLRPASSR